MGSLAALGKAPAQQHRAGEPPSALPSPLLRVRQVRQVCQRIHHVVLSWAAPRNSGERQGQPAHPDKRRNPAAPLTHVPPKVALDAPEGQQDLWIDPKLALEFL